MKTTKTILPGQPGAKKWRAKYGDSLICVRYRDNNHTHKRIRTVELIVEVCPLKRKKDLIPTNKILLLRIGYKELHLRRIVKEAGGRWNRKKQAWELPYGQIQALGFEKRIIKEMPMNRNNNKKIK